MKESVKKLEALMKIGGIKKDILFPGHFRYCTDHQYF